MKLSIKDCVLVLVSSCSGEISGKTLLQKRLFFVGELLGLKGLGYAAHYYGPYSQLVASATNQLVSLGFLEEQTIGFGADDLGFEKRRVDYHLTDDGREVLAYLKRKNKKEVEAINEACQHLLSAGDLDYFALSHAAKAYFLLKEEGHPMTREEIRAKAESFHWKIAPDNLDRAIDFLIKLDLARHHSSVSKKQNHK